jgi:hypothetical protein
MPDAADDMFAAMMRAAIDISPLLTTPMRQPRFSPLSARHSAAIRRRPPCHARRVYVAAADASAAIAASRCRQLSPCAARRAAAASPRHAAEGDMRRYAARCAAAVQAKGVMRCGAQQRRSRASDRREARVAKDAQQSARKRKRRRSAVRYARYERCARRRCQPQHASPLLPRRQRSFDADICAAAPLTQFSVCRHMFRPPVHYGAMRATPRLMLSFRRRCRHAAIIFRHASHFR